MIRIQDRNEGMIGDVSISGKDVVLELKKEPVTRGFLEVHDYNLHFDFCARVEGRGPSKWRFWVGCGPGEILPGRLDWLWMKKDEGPFDLVRISGRMGGKGRYSFELELSIGDHRIANFLPVDHRIVMETIRENAKNSGGKESTIGRSVMGRDIAAFSYEDDPSRPNLLFLSGFHPPEGDIVALRAISALMADGDFRERALGRFNVHLVPLCNPDGYTLRTQGSNRNGINFYWKFMGNDEAECPESRSIWKFASELEPLFCMDFHAFTFQPNGPRPYAIPPYLHGDRRLRRAQDRINRGLSDACGSRYGSLNRMVAPAKILAPNLLSTALFLEHGTLISPKFHLHMAQGEESSGKLAVECAAIAVSELSAVDFERISTRSRSRRLRYGSIFALNRAIHALRR